jgi:4-diphosphocytidyl-2-C-methyl-D-erythritol kinase
VIVNPGIHVSTGWAFNNITPQAPTISVQQIIQQPIETWKDVLVNDFEEPVIQNRPEIGNIKQQLYNNGAVYASMTGSGSTVFGIFHNHQQPVFSFPDHYFYYLNQA